MYENSPDADWNRASNAGSVIDQGAGPEDIVRWLTARALSPGTHPSGDSPARREQVVAVAAHLGLLSADLLRVGDRAPHTLAYAQDLRATLAWATADAEALLQRLDDLTDTLVKKWKHPRIAGARLLTRELAHAAGHLLSRALQLGVTVDPALQPGGALHGLIREPRGRSPLDLTPADLLPPSSGVAPGREAALFDALVTGNEHEQQAAALLFWVNARDQLEVAPIVLALNYAAFNLIAAQDLRREEGLALDAPRALRRVAEDLRAELGNVRVEGLRQGQHVPRGSRDVALSDGLSLLRNLRAQHQEGAGSREERMDEVLWASFDTLDRALASGETPETDPTLRATLLLHCLYALVRLPRAPGMRLTPTAQFAAEMSGVDPLWGWRECATRDQDAEYLSSIFERLIQIPAFLSLLGERANVERVLGLLGRDLFARARDLGVRLPHEHALRTYFAAFGPQQVSRLSEAEFEDLRAEIHRLERLPLGLDSAPPQQEPPPAPEVPLEPPATVQAPQEAPEPTPSIREVQEARDLLRGKRVTMLGGRPSEHHRRALIRELDLGELDWIGADEYAHGRHAESHVRPETALVVLAVRQMSHAHSGLREVAQERGVPCVMHPGGFSPNSLAFQIMRQAGERLRVKDTSA